MIFTSYFKICTLNTYRKKASTLRQIFFILSLSTTYSEHYCVKCSYISTGLNLYVHRVCMYDTCKSENNFRRKLNFNRLRKSIVFTDFRNFYITVRIIYNKYFVQFLKKKMYSHETKTLEP